MKKLYFLIGLLLISGCATIPKGAVLVNGPEELPTIQREKAELLAKLSIGMPLSEFKNIFPEAYLAGQSNETIAYEIVSIYKYVTQHDIDNRNIYLFWLGPVGVGREVAARTEKQILWFYFYDNRLVQWGHPQDWPKRPDIVFEQRK